MSLTGRALSLTLAVVVLTPLAAAAQTPVTFGVKGGVNIATLKFEDDEDNPDVKSLVGAVAGIFLGKQFNDNIGLRGEALFSQKGAKDRETGEDAKNKLTYIDVPILLTLGPSSSSDTRFNVFTGPQFSFNTKAEFEDQSGETDIDDQVKSTDFGWVLGAGLEKGRLTADARYTLGLSNIAEGGGKVKNRVFSVMIGVKLK
jgi:opacity protein-like surface antigen